MVLHYPPQVVKFSPSLWGPRSITRVYGFPIVNTLDQTVPAFGGRRNSCSSKPGVAICPIFSRVSFSPGLFHDFSAPRSGHKFLSPLQRQISQDCAQLPRISSNPLPRSLLLLPLPSPGCLAFSCAAPRDQAPPTASIQTAELVLASFVSGVVEV